MRVCVPSHIHMCRRRHGCMTSNNRKALPPILYNSLSLLCLLIQESDIRPDALRQTKRKTTQTHRLGGTASELMGWDNVITRWGERNLWFVIHEKKGPHRKRDLSGWIKSCFGVGRFLSFFFSSFLSFILHCVGRDFGTSLSGWMPVACILLTASLLKERRRRANLR